MGTIIDDKLFGELVRYFCLEVYDDEQMNQHIKQQLEEKLKKKVNHLEYSKQIQERLEQ